MPQLDINQLSGSLKGALQPLYVIHGEEDLLRIEALDSIRAVAKQRGYLNRESYTVENANFDWNEVLANADSAGLFADLKLLEIHIPSGKVGKNGGEALQQLAENLPRDTVTLEAKAVSSNALPAWINARLQQHGLEAEAAAIALFAERVEGNLLAAKQEVDKLALLFPQGHLISIQDAQESVANVARFDVFQLAAAWMGGNVRRTAHLLDALAADDEEPVLLLWAVAEDVRTLIRLSAALKQGKTVQAVRNELRLWGDKQQYASQAAQRLTVPRLMDALKTCAQIDRQIKGAEAGDARAALRQLVMQLAT